MRCCILLLQLLLLLLLRWRWERTDFDNSSLVRRDYASAASSSTTMHWPHLHAVSAEAEERSPSDEEGCTLAYIQEAVSWATAAGYASGCVGSSLPVRTCPSQELCARLSSDCSSSPKQLTVQTYSRRSQGEVVSLHRPL